MKKGGEAASAHHLLSDIENKIQMRAPRSADQRPPSGEFAGWAFRLIHILLPLLTRCQMDRGAPSVAARAAATRPGCACRLFHVSHGGAAETAQPHPNTQQKTRCDIGAQRSLQPGCACERVQWAAGWSEQPWNDVSCVFKKKKSIHNASTLPSRA